MTGPGRLGPGRSTGLTSAPSPTGLSRRRCCFRTHGPGGRSARSGRCHPRQTWSFVVGEVWEEPDPRLVSGRCSANAIVDVPSGGPPGLARAIAQARPNARWLRGRDLASRGRRASSAGYRSARRPAQDAKRSRGPVATDTARCDLPNRRQSGIASGSTLTVTQPTARPYQTRPRIVVRWGTETHVP
jgi:hypothetical protein